MRWIMATALLLATAAGTSPARADTPSLPRLADERVLLRTNRGDLVLALYPDVAPAHVAQILKLVRLGVYDSTWFFRVDPRFVVQLTNAQSRRFPLTPEQRAAIRKLPAELSSLPHRPGVLSMAHADGDPNSGETSFSFLLVRSPHLDGKYTIFGELEWGAAVLAAIAMTPRDGENRPLREVLVEKALVKTEAEIARMRAAGELQQSVPLPRDAVTVGEQTSIQPGEHIVAAGLGLMVALSLLGFLLSGRIEPHRASAFYLLTILTGAFLLIRQSVPRAPGNALLATGLFFGMVALFKLMNRFEAARVPAPGPQPVPAPAPQPVPAASPRRADAPP
jgi:cyclophilin family peptidyl-prolyl cis-trans isomerase